jgi:hypothetical protein
MSDALQVLTLWCDENTNTLEPIGKARDILDALADAGLVIVPREPTEKMHRAGFHTASGASDIYRAMVEAANEQ